MAAPRTVLTEAAASQLAENATMLWTLSEVVDPPKENKPIIAKDDARALTPERERQLASDFAFIATTNDDFRGVMAACVEENSHEAGLTIRLASNSKNLNQLREQLQQMVEKLKILSPKSSRDPSTQALFHNIILIDRERILSRLRSRHVRSRKSRAGKKPPMMDVIRRTVRESIARRKHSLSQPKTLILQSKIDTLSQLSSAIENKPKTDVMKGLTDGILAEIIEQAYSVQIADLEMLLQGTRKASPKEQEYSPRALQKLSQYFRIAQSLVNMARDPKYPDLRNITIQVLGQPSDINRMPTMADFDSCSRRIGASQSASITDRHLSRAQTAVKKRYNNACMQQSEAKCKRKIHAEIQLLLFYEKYPLRPSPRWLCSNKRACYLCDLFIRSHGRFYTPSSHGKIYLAWRIPQQLEVTIDACNRIEAAVAKMNASLELKIVNLALQAVKRRLVDPYESALDLRHLCSAVTSIATVSSSAISEYVAAADDTSDRSPDERIAVILDSSATRSPFPSHLGSSSGSTSSSRPTSSESCTVSCPQLEIDFESRHGAMEMGHGTQETSSDTPTVGSSIDRSDSSSSSSASSLSASSIHLKSNATISQDLGAADVATRILTPGLTVHVSHDGFQIPCGIRAELVQPDQVSAFEETATVINVRSLQPGQEIETEAGAVDSNRMLGLKVGKRVVGLRFVGLAPPDWT